MIGSCAAGPLKLTEKNTAYNPESIIESGFYAVYFLSKGGLMRV
jgi:hypothetical protein